MVSMKIYLDDIREIPEGWTGARTIEEFKDVVKRVVESGEYVEAISFDHDLGQDKFGVNRPDGYDAVKWLAEHYPEYIVGDTEITAHSANPAGRENIEKYIEFCRKRKELLIDIKKDEMQELKLK
jgi:hypothetical protein